MVTIQPYTLKNKEKRYRFKFYLGIDPLTGKEMSTTKSGFKTKTYAKDALSELQNELRKGLIKKKRLRLIKIFIISGLNTTKIPYRIVHF